MPLARFWKGARTRRFTLPPGDRCNCSLFCKKDRVSGLYHPSKASARKGASFRTTHPVLTAAVLSDGHVRHRRLQFRVCHAVLRNFQRDEVCLSFFQSLEKLRRIAYCFHTELGTDGFFGKVFGLNSNCSRILFLIFIISVGPDSVTAISSPFPRIWSKS